MGRLTSLHQTIIESYADNDGLKGLCLALDIRFDDLRGETLSTKAYSLIRTLEDAGRLPDLLAQGKRDFPNRTWDAPAPPDATTPNEDADIYGQDAAISIKDNIGQVAIGSKNVIQIGTLNLPRNLVLIGLVAILGVGALIVVLSAITAGGVTKLTSATATPKLGPMTMSGQFNIVVAQAAEIDPNNVQQETATGLRVSGWLADSLHKELVNIGSVQLWHDGLSLDVKGRHIGIITGTNATERWGEARRLAKEVGAQLVIYGNLDKGEFAPEFYVDVAANKLTGEADEIIGEHKLGPPAPATAGLSSQTEYEARAIFVRGLVYDLLGEHSKALTDFQSISSRYKNSLVAGNETLPYFIGREMLFMLDLQTGQSRENVLVDMRAAFEQSLAINSSYIPAQLGLANALLKSAEPVITEGDGTTPMFATATRTINAAITQFNSALKTAKDNSDRNPLLVTKTQIALANAHRLDGLGKLITDQREPSQNAFNLAKQQLVLASEGAGMDKPRIAAIRDWTLGATLFYEAALKFRLGDDAASRDSLKASRDVLTACGQRYDNPETKVDIDRTLIDYKQLCAETLGQVQLSIENGF